MGSSWPRSCAHLVIFYFFFAAIGRGWCDDADPNALTAEWRRECLAFAKVRKLTHVEEMRVLYLVRSRCGSSPDLGIHQFNTTGLCMPSTGD